MPIIDPFDSPAPSKKAIIDPFDSAVKQPEAEGTFSYLAKKLGRGVVDTASGVGRSGEIAYGGLAHAIGDIANKVGANKYAQLLHGEGDRAFGAADNLRDSTEFTNQDLMPVNEQAMSKGQRIAGSVVSSIPTLAAMIANPALGAGLMESGSMNQTVDDIKDKGLDTLTAQKLLLARTGGNAAMLALPMTVGSTLAKKVATGAAIAPAQTATVSATEKALLDSNGYHDEANKIDPLDLESIVPSALIGGAFGGKAYHEQYSRDNRLIRDIQNTFNQASADADMASIERANREATFAKQDDYQQHEAILRANGIMSPQDPRAARAIEIIKGKAETVPQEQPSLATIIAGNEAGNAFVADSGAFAGRNEAEARLAGEVTPNMEETMARTMQANGLNPQSVSEAFDLANLRQQRADTDLLNNNTIAPDYVAGLAAHSGGTVNGQQIAGTKNFTGDMRTVYMFGDRQFHPVTDGRTGEPIITPNGDMYGRFIDANGNETQGTVKQRFVKQFNSPANPRQAQDFMATSSEPRKGIGEGTMAQEKMPRRSSDRISGDVAGGKASPLSDPYNPEARAPSGDVTVEQAPQERQQLRQPRQTDTVDNGIGGTGMRTVDGEGVRTPYDRTVDNTPRLENQTGNESNRLPSPDSEVTGSRRTDSNGNTTSETFAQRGVREEQQRKQDIVDNYSRNELGNTAKNVGRMDTDPSQQSSRDVYQSERRATPKHPVDERLNDDKYRGLLQTYANEAGWATVGGKLIRDHETGDVKGRTTWEGKADWWQHAPKPLRAGDGNFFREAVNKSLTGGKLTKSETAAVKWVLDHADGEMKHADIQALGKELGFSPYVLEGRKVTMDVEVGGKNVKVEQDAVSALHEAKTRIDSLRMLMDCLG